MRTIRKVRLSEIAELITKGTTPTTLGYDFQDNGVNFLKIECFSENGDFIKEKVAHISEKCHERLKRSQLRAGDVLFSIAGAIGRVAIVTKKCYRQILIKPWRLSELQETIFIYRM